MTLWDAYRVFSIISMTPKPSFWYRMEPGGAALSPGEEDRPAVSLLSP
ncbi:MAG TPA: hypothetical protein VFQ13_19960 [Anaerolineales bacterium]|nr:hypothetical protein [Anaerolineales bacterium]